MLTFQTGNTDAFEIPLSYVNQCVPGKNEVTMEFHPVRAKVFRRNLETSRLLLKSFVAKVHFFDVFFKNDEAAVALTEIRFHIPGSELAGEDPVEQFRDQV